jgi:hypothetical protein
MWAVKPLHHNRLIWLAAALLCLAGLAATLVEIQAAPDIPAESFSIPWWTVDNGGGTSQGGAYLLSGTIGQPDPVNSSGGIYLLKGGFWSGLIDYRNFLPLLYR